MLDRRARARFARSRAGVAGAVVVGALIAFALVGPLVAKHGPFESDFVHGVAPSLMPVGPSAEFPLGADRIYRDMLSRLAWGGRISLAIAAGSTALAAAIGAFVGLAAGYTEGRRVRAPWPLIAGLTGALVAVSLGRPGVGGLSAMIGVGLSVAGRFGGPRVDLDGTLMRFVDVLLAFPFLLLVMAIGAAVEGASMGTIVLMLGLTGWLSIARLVRAKTMEIRALDYVTAAQALGHSAPGVILRHVLPNISGTIVVVATVQAAQMIVADAALSFLGVGIPPPMPTWGRMLFEGKDYYVTAPWLVAAPAAIILLAVWGFNMLGEGLRDALDPREA